MDIRARVRNAGCDHEVSVSTDGRMSSLVVPAKRTAPGSSINGGELLCLALATCYCNDLYREAGLRGVDVTGVEVEVAAEFGGAGEPARRITYSARVTSDAPAAEIAALLRQTDAVAEVHKTLRAGVPVEFVGSMR